MRSRATTFVVLEPFRKPPPLRRNRRFAQLTRKCGSRFPAVLVRRKIHLRMAVRHDGLVFAVCVKKLLDVLTDDAHFDAVGCADGHRLIYGIQFPELRELVEH